MAPRIDGGIKSSEITPESAFCSRRELLKAAVAAGLVGIMIDPGEAATIPPNGELKNLKDWPGAGDVKPNSYQDITTYNNYYEFGTGKGDPAKNAGTTILHFMVARFITSRTPRASVACESRRGLTWYAFWVEGMSGMNSTRALRFKAAAFAGFFSAAQAASCWSMSARHGGRPWRQSSHGRKS